MNTRKRIAGTALLTAAISIGGGLALTSPASAGPIDFCDLHPKACYLQVEESRFKLPDPPECLSCPTDFVRFDERFTVIPTFDQQVVFDRQVAFGR